MGQAAVVDAPPTGWKRLAWLGPGLLWMVSAAGSGELLFSPRVGALYGYALLWALVLAVVMKWFINREIGRYTTCTGRRILDGFHRLPGPRDWAVWIILGPQALVAVATIAGLGSGAATALVLALPGSIALWTVVSVAAATALVVFGRYGGVEMVARVIAGALAVAAIVAAIMVAPPPGEVGAGLVPQVPPGMDPGEVLPWLGFMLSGAAGMVWYSYWIGRKGYGMAGVALDARGNPPDPEHFDARTKERLRGWVRQMTLDNTVAVVGTLVIALGFLVLGAQVLRPEGLVPEEERMAAVLGRLLGELWGPVGFWFMVLGVYVGFWSTVLSDQDGFGRMFANGTRLAAGRFLPARWRDERRLKAAFVVVLTAILPVALYLLVGQPVRLLQAAGAIEAAHIPVLAWLTLYLNHRELPEGLRPSRFVVVATALAGLSFALFALYYVWTLIPGGR